MFLHLALKGLRELHFLLGINPKGIKAVRLPVDPVTKSADLPDDYVDYWVVAYETQNKLRALGSKGFLSDLIGKDIATYPVVTESNDYSVYRFIETLGQDGFTGGLYGYGGGVMPNSFKIVPHMNKIQFDPGTTYNEVYMCYITDGIVPNVATEVHPYAVQTLESYIMWKYKDNSRRYNRFEIREAKEEFMAELRILRARINKISPVDIVRSLKRGTRRTYK